MTNDFFNCVPCDFDKDGISGDGHRVTRSRVASGTSRLTTPVNRLLRPEAERRRAVGRRVPVRGGFPPRAS